MISMIPFRYLKSYVGVLKLLTVIVGTVVSVLGVITHLSACIDPRYDSNYLELEDSSIDPEYDCTNMTIKCRCTQFISPTVRSIQAKCTALQEKRDFFKKKEKAAEGTKQEVLATSGEEIQEHIRGECRYLPVVGLEDAFLIIVVFGTFTAVLNMTVSIMLDHFSVVTDTLKLMDLFYNAVKAALFITAAIMCAVSAVQIDEYPAKVKCLQGKSQEHLSPLSPKWRKCYSDYFKSFDADNENNTEFRLRKNRERDFSMFRLKLVIAGFTLLNGINYCLVSYIIYHAWKKLSTRVRKLTFDSVSSEDLSEKSSDEEGAEDLTDEEGNLPVHPRYQARLNSIRRDSGGDVGLLAVTSLRTTVQTNSTAAGSPNRLSPPTLQLGEPLPAAPTPPPPPLPPPPALSPAETPNLLTVGTPKSKDPPLTSSVQVKGGKKNGAKKYSWFGFESPDD